jgi:hypothetical protein
LISRQLLPNNFKLLEVKNLEGSMSRAHGFEIFWGFFCRQRLRHFDRASHATLQMQAPLRSAKPFATNSKVRFTIHLQLNYCRWMLMGFTQYTSTRDLNTVLGGKETL